MKSVQKILWWLFGFYTIMTAIYTYWTVITYGEPEWVGVVTLALMAVFAVFIGFYLGVENKPFRVRVLPEDRLDAEIDEADHDLGHFSPWSWWPIGLAAAVAVALIGASTGWWLAFFGAPLLIVTLFGWVYEYYRGRFAH